MSTTGTPAGDSNGVEAAENVTLGNVQEIVVQQNGSTDNTQGEVDHPNGSVDNALEEVSHHNGSTDKLLQLAQAASGPIIQVPADALTSLLHSLNGLQTSVTELRHENRGLQRTLSRVEKNVQKLEKRLTYFGGDFVLFPKLPLEIQRMIWRHSANIPQIIGVKWAMINGYGQYVSTASHSHQLRVCTAARSEALKIRLRMELIPTRREADRSYVPHIFSNPVTDTLWLTMSDPYVELRALDSWHCFGSGQDLHALRVKKVAMSCEYWRENNIYEPSVYLLEEFCSLKTEQLILVVAGLSARNSHDIAFIEPRGTPSSMLSRKTFQKRWKETITWEMIAEEDLESMRVSQADRAEERKTYLIETGLHESDVDWEAADLEDLSLLAITSIRYVEATTMTELRISRGR